MWHASFLPACQGHVCCLLQVREYSREQGIALVRNLAQVMTCLGETAANLPPCSEEMEVRSASLACHLAAPATAVNMLHHSLLLPRGCSVNEALERRRLSGTPLIVLFTTPWPSVVCSSGKSDPLKVLINAADPSSLCFGRAVPVPDKLKPAGAVPVPG